MQEWNVLDIELYNYALDLSKQSVDRWETRGKIEQEEFMNNAFDPIKSCKRPPLELSSETLNIALGGKGCSKVAFYMISGVCFQHSSEPLTA